MRGENNLGLITNTSSTKDDIHTHKDKDTRKFTFTINSRVMSNVILAKRYSQCVTWVHPDYQDYKEPFTVVCMCTYFLLNFHCFWVQLKSLQSTSFSHFKPICRNFKFRTSYYYFQNCLKCQPLHVVCPGFAWRLTADVPGWELLQSVSSMSYPPPTHTHT